jgi:hypothetical protein
MEPNAMPMSSIDSTMPSAARLMPHSVAMPGEAKLIDITSKPSRALSATVMTTTKTWSALMGAFFRMSRGSDEVGIAREAYDKPDLFVPRIAPPSPRLRRDKSWLQVFRPAYRLVLASPSNSTAGGA